MCPTRLIEISSATFPETAKNAFMRYARDCRVNPYNEIKIIQLEAAENMISCLKSSLRFNKKDCGKILDFLGGIRENRPLPAFLIHNFPSDPPEKIRSTPTGLDFGPEPDKIGKDGYIAEIAMLAANTISGTTPSITEGIHGSYPFHHLSPRLGLEKTPNGLGTITLPWHTEDTWMPDNDMHISLFCIKNKKTPTLLVSAQDVYNAMNRVLDKKEMDTLEDERFLFISAPSPDSKAEQKFRVKPIVKIHEGKITEMNIYANADKMKAADPEDREAQIIVGKMIDILQSFDQGAILSPNDFLSIHNLQNVHARGQIHPEDLQSENQRHIIRTQARWENRIADHITSLDM